MLARLDEESARGSGPGGDGPSVFERLPALRERNAELAERKGAPKADPASKNKCNGDGKPSTPCTTLSLKRAHPDT
jgi:hypothetical protein